jgi:hypothetical protein
MYEINKEIKIQIQFDIIFIFYVVLPHDGHRQHYTFQVGNELFMSQHRLALS